MDHRNRMTTTCGLVRIKYILNGLIRKQIQIQSKVNKSEFMDHEQLKKKNAITTTSYAKVLIYSA